ncbi:Uncharacterised protein [Serratia quinivorans]|uniref:Uncharacterized protein n=1 Tax=Serratia quinivorans TaxID=137545 RepID=A0A379ZYA0_9GAMM|nr:Uncharacterised protein [Serratia quinivorans]CAI1023276.1 Uncharacterised protein [Serratia entomophila]CAI1718409.1 Uncharacterised protein [Serratia proteamaculans]CAI1031263.1 Uncharacterised protein [Serratia quinivorans]CAI1036377.1 Uncharacterised protein [Serratia quinivorans]
MLWLWRQCERMSRPQGWAFILLFCSAFWLSVLLLLCLLIRE